MTEKASEITELLRAGTDMDYTDLINELFALKEDRKKLCED